MAIFDTEKFADSQKAGLDLLQQVTGKLFESADQLGEIQFKTQRAASDVQFDSLDQLASARDPQAFTEW